MGLAAAMRDSRSRPPPAGAVEDARGPVDDTRRPGEAGAGPPSEAGAGHITPLEG
jgi:hypothetical protein